MEVMNRLTLHRSSLQCFWCPTLNESGCNVWRKHFYGHVPACFPPSVTVLTDRPCVWSCSATHCSWLLLSGGMQQMLMTVWASSWSSPQSNHRRQYPTSWLWSTVSKYQVLDENTRVQTSKVKVVGHSFPVSVHPSINASKHPCLHASIHSFIHASKHPCIHASMHPCIYASMHPCIHAPMHLCIYASMRSCIHASMHPCIHASMHSFIHASMHPFIHTSMHQCIHSSMPLYCTSIYCVQSKT
jgi:hypothetical protein